MYTNQTDRFPVRLYGGDQYIIVLIELDRNAMLAEAMRNHTSSKLINAYQALVDWLKACGIKPKLYILDNECSDELSIGIKTNGIKYRRNISEEVVQTFKNHLVAVLCGMDEKFPM